MVASMFPRTFAIVLLFGCMAAPCRSQTQAVPPAKNRVANAPLAAPAPAAATVHFLPQPPEWSPLPKEHQEYLDKVLNYWEYKGNQIQRYTCQFQRWEYDPVFGPKEPNTCKTFSTGTIRFAGPDKGLFKVESTKHWTAPKNPGEKPTYEDRANGTLEHWVCNGTSIFQFDAQKKQLIETVLPKEMQGKAIVDGPLPFLFGAKADKIKERYWMRVITPRDVKGEYWLEAVPKTQQDASNFKMVHVMLDEKEFLPIGLVIFSLNHSPELPARTTLKFDQREVNASNLANTLNPLHREFFEVKVPTGWEKIVQQYDTDPAEPATVPVAAPANQVRRPTAPAPR